MIALLLSGDGTILEVAPSRAQLPLLLAQAQNLSTVPIGQATETDTALPVTTLLSGAAIIQVGIATETDTALPVVVDQPPSLFVSVGMATETDTALAVTFVASGGVFVEIGMATETDTAFPITNDQDFLDPDFTNTLSLTPVSEEEISLTPVTVE